MIELYEGVPGSGKSYHAICEKFLPWVKQGRRLYIAVDGIYLDRLSLFTGIELQTLEQQITIWKDSVEVLQAFQHVEPGSAVIIDEAHRAASSTNRAILTHYRNTGALILGLTATPSRGDGQPLDEFEQLVTGPSVRELVRMGNLVPCQVFAPDRVLERGVARDPVELVTSECMDSRAVIFAPDGASAQVIHERLCTAGYRTETVLDGTPGEIRRGVRDRLKSGETRGIVTVRAVVEGFDAPVLDTAVLCGAFTTITPWLQAIGRVTRAHPGKTHARVYDLRGAVYLHGLPEDDRVWSLAGEQGRSTAERPAGLRTCRACHAVFPPCTRCPRCGSVLVSDPRPMRVQRAEMFEASTVPVAERAAKYIDGTERSMVARGMRPAKAAMMAREKAPSWVREALAGASAGETQRRAG